MKTEELQKILRLLNKTELQIILWNIRLHLFRHKMLNVLRRVDLWLFPPLAFVSSYKAISQIIPAQHPMAFNAVMTTSFMCATLTLLLLRPLNKSRKHNFDNFRSKTG